MAREDALVTRDGNDYPTHGRAQGSAEGGVLGYTAIAPARFVCRADCSGGHSPDGGTPQHAAPYRGAMTNDANRQRDLRSRRRWCSEIEAS